MYYTPNLASKLLLGLAIALIVFCISSFIFSLLSLSAQHHSCVNIESLKSRVRIRAIEDFKHLDANGKLLGIKITPQLRAEAKKQRDRTLADYAAQSCGSYFNLSGI